MAKEKDKKPKTKLEKPKLKPVIITSGEGVPVMVKPSPPRIQMKVLVSGSAKVTSSSSNVVIVRND